MSEMLELAMMMSDQGGDPIEVLMTLCTAMAIEESDGGGGSIGDDAICQLTDKALNAAATGGQGTFNGDCYTLSARCLAIFLEGQAKINLSVNISSNIGRQLTALIRQLPLCAPTAANSNQTSQLLRYQQTSPGDFIEEVMRILHLYTTYRRSFSSSNVSVPGDSVLLCQSLELLGVSNRRVLPSLAAFCCSRIIICGLHGERVVGERASDVFLRMLTAELESDDMSRAEHYLRIATCFLVRAGDRDDRHAALFADRFFKLLVARVKSHGNTRLLTLALRVASAAVFAPGGGVASLLQHAGGAMRELLHLAFAVDEHTGMILSASQDRSEDDDDMMVAAAAGAAASATDDATAAPASPLTVATTQAALRGSKMRLTLPTLFAPTRSSRVGPVAKNEDATVSDTTWALSVVSLIVAGGGHGSTTPRVEPRQKWTWQAGDANNDYTPEAMHALTNSFLLKSTQARVQTPHGQFNCNFDTMGQASNDNKRIRAINSSFLPEGVDLVDPLNGLGGGGGSGAAAAAYAPPASGGGGAAAPPVVAFLRSVADSNFLHELGKLRSSEHKSVVDATILRLLELGVFNQAVAQAAAASSQVAHEAGGEVSAMHEEVSHALLELLQNSNMPNACMHALASLLRSSAAGNTTSKKAWVAFLAECGFTDMLAALVSAAPPPSAARTDEDDSSGGKAKNSGSRRQRGGRGASGPGRGGGNNNNNNAGAFFDDEDQAIVIDPTVGAELLSMLAGDDDDNGSGGVGARDPEAAKRSIQDTMRLAVAKMRQLEEQQDADQDNGNSDSARTPPQTNREMRALLMEFGQKVRSGRSNPRKLLRDICDASVMPPSALASFIAPDASLAKTLARTAAAAWFGPHGKNMNARESQAFSSVSQCGGNVAKVSFKHPPRSCANGHALTATNSVNAGSGCSLCGAGDSDASAAASRPAPMMGRGRGGGGRGRGGGGGAAGAVVSIPLHSCSTCHVRYCESCCPNHPPGGFDALSVSLLATVCDIYRLVQKNSPPAVLFHRDAENTAAQQQQPLRGPNRLCFSFPAGGAARALPIPASMPVLALTNTLASNSGGGKQKQKVMAAVQAKKPEISVDSVVFPSLSAAGTAATNFGPVTVSAAVDGHLAPLRYLQQVVPDTLALSFAEELSAWLHIGAVDITLGGSSGLHKKVVECMPALRLCLPLAARFDLWRYCAVGARRRALHYSAEQGYTPSGDVPLHLTLRKMDEHAFAVEDREKTDMVREFVLRAEQLVAAPLHTRMDCYFKGEVGRGEGPTQEVYSELSRQAVQRRRELWCADGATVGGLIPAPGSDSQMFALGVACGRALLDGFVVHVPLHEMCFKIINSTSSSSQHGSNTKDNNNSLQRSVLQLVDPSFVQNVQALSTMSNEDLAATGLDDDDGNTLTRKAVPQYIESTLGTRYRDISKAVLAFGIGLQRIVDYNFLRALFSEADLSVVIGGNSGSASGPLYTAEELDQVIVPAHGFNAQSPQVHWFKRALLSLSHPEEQQDFVEFLTGSRALPCGGLLGLSSPITMSRKDFDDGDRKQGTLPSCSTCFLYCKFPAYDSYETLRERLVFAIKHGRRTFSHS